MQLLYGFSSSFFFDVKFKQIVFSIEQLSIDIKLIIGDHFLQLGIFYLQLNQCLRHFKFLFFTLYQLSLQISLRLDYVIKPAFHLLQSINQLGFLISEFEFFKVFFDEFLFQFCYLKVIVVCIIAWLHRYLVVELDELNAVFPQQANGSVVIDNWEIHDLLALFEGTHG